MRRLPFVFLVSLALFPLRPFADEASESGSRQISPWREPNRVVLELLGGKTENVAKWTIEFGSRGDFLLELANPSEVSVVNGQILVLEGQVMVVHGLELERGYEIDAIDMPAFHSQLLYALLEVLFPEGPESVSETQEVEYAESDASIAVETASAIGEFAAPWFVKGTVSRRNEHAVDYDLTYTFTVDPEDAVTFTLHLRGIWSGGAAQLSLEDDVSIDGWAVYEIGPFDVEGGEGDMARFGARPVGRTYRTVGELRETLDPDDAEEEGE